MRRDRREGKRRQRREDLQGRREDRRDERQAWYDTRRFSEVRSTVFRMVEVGYNDRGITRGYDVLSFILIILNVIASILFTFDYTELHYGTLLHWVEAVSVAFFAIDYVLRIWTAPLLFPQDRTRTAIRKYMFSFWGIVDLVSFLPYYLPFFFPQGAAVFRFFRVMRLFRLFRINAYYDSLATITSVLKSRKQQLLSSIFIILVLMLSASLMMYSIEHDAQPEVFRNALSGIWWASSALLTIGYGDMYPVTVLGKVLGMIIEFLGVGMVAIPTGIISAGFVEQYQRIKEMQEEVGEVDFHFIKVQLNYNDEWVGTKIKDLNLPTNVVVAVIQRGDSTIVPRGNVVLEEDDTLVLGAESAHNKNWDLDLKEIILKSKHPWNGQYIRDLDISRQTFIVLVRRQNRSMVPNGNLMLKEGDTVVLYSKKHIQDAVDIEI
ncbi:MAG: ion transporter [Clostridia bacterium]|nr:ion transporter [Clostridia bacterium]MBR1704757.1 ion transporter [Clostridia bacterium]